MYELFVDTEYMEIWFIRALEKEMEALLLEPLRKKTRCFEFPVAMVLEQVMIQDLIFTLVCGTMCSAR